jgi:hypothetical protein
MTSDYLPKENERQKAFQIVPSEDSRTKVILEARRQVLEDPALDFGARVLYARLLDLSLNWYTHRADGVVCISVTKLCEMLKCAPRTIHRWNSQLVARRHVWISEQKMPNMWPVNTYHISALDSEQEPRQMPTKDGLWGNGERRHKFSPEIAPPVTPLPESHAANFAGLAQNPQKSPEKAPATGHGRPVSHAKKSPGRGHRWHRGEATGGTGERPPVAPGRGHGRHRGEATGGTGHRPPVAHNKESREARSEGLLGGGTPPPCSNGWKRKLKKLYPRELEALKAELRKQQTQADPADKGLAADLAARIEAIDLELYGGKAPEKRRATRPARVSTSTAKAPTAEEILDGARYLVGIGKASSLTEAQREALAAAEEAR